MPEAANPFEIALFDTAALRAVEADAAALLDNPFELMRRAGRAAWREVLQRWPQAQRLLVVCGPGNNGGDGYVLATHALCAGREVQVVSLPGAAPQRDPALRGFDAYVAAGGHVHEFGGVLPAADIVVDALFGIGLSRAPDAAAAALIEAINTHVAPVLALDVPSGVDAERGSAPDIAVRASYTLEFLACKPGLRTGAALDHVGGLALASLDVDEAFDGVVPAATALQAGALARWLRPRARDTHKGAHGRALCIGGDHGSGGAIVLCAQAALRSGAGLVEVLTRAAHVPALLARVPEAMAHACDDAEPLGAWFDRADCIALGPGLGQGAWGAALLARAIAAGKPLVLDADALNLLAAKPVPLSADTVLTPHPGEAARLLGVGTADIQRDRYAATRELARRHGCTVVLKGAGSLVATPDGEMRVIAAGNPGMAVGGMGDLLTGVIAALRAQGVPAFEAASCGALLHAAAGDAAADGGERGLLPSDLLAPLRRLANPGAVS